MHGPIIIKVNALDLGTCMIDLFGKQALMHDCIPSTPFICMVAITKSLCIGTMHGPMNGPIV